MRNLVMCFVEFVEIVEFVVSVEGSDRIYRIDMIYLRH
jgi:hypothetical protein